MNSKTLLTLLLMVLVFGVGLLIGRFTAPGGGFVSNAGRTVSTGGENGSTSANVAAVSAASLTDGQRNMLRALGINADEIVITPQMIACAEAKLGAARVEEIKNGATPSFTEGAKLVACYK